MKIPSFFILILVLFHPTHLFYHSFFASSSSLLVSLSPYFNIPFSPSLSFSFSQPFLNRSLSVLSYFFIHYLFFFFFLSYSYSLSCSFSFSPPLFYNFFPLFSLNFYPHTYSVFFSWFCQYFHFTPRLVVWDAFFFLAFYFNLFILFTIF